MYTYNIVLITVVNIYFCIYSLYSINCSDNNFINCLSKISDIDQQLFTDLSDVNNYCIEVYKMNSMWSIAQLT